MPFDRLQPYNDLPLLPPGVDLETKAVLKAAIDANRLFWPTCAGWRRRFRIRAC